MNTQDTTSQSAPSAHVDKPHIARLAEDFAEACVTKGYVSTSDPTHAVLVAEALRLEGAQRALQIVDRWLHVPTLKLRAGEMTAQELRTVKAVLNGLRAELVAD